MSEELTPPIVDQAVPELVRHDISAILKRHQHSPEAAAKLQAEQAAAHADIEAATRANQVALLNRLSDDYAKALTDEQRATIEAQVVGISESLAD